MRLPSVFVILSIILSMSYGYPHTENQNGKSQNIQMPDQSFEDAAAYPSEHQTETTFPHEFHEDSSFYPSFSQFQTPPLGHSRPFYFQQEGAYSQRPVSPFQQQLSYDTYRGGGDKYTANEESRSYGLLGSGNFGVISGGTFYNDNEGDATGFENRFENYYQNGHGRPSLFLGKLAKASRNQQQQEPFANFRDFADINTPSYSQYVVVYTNKHNSNLTEQSINNKRPKNIIEQLAMIDQENTSTSAPEKKLSKSKRKLSLLMPEKKTKINQLKKEKTQLLDLGEPLLALS
ncbi:hypothetical protein RN001_005512 [Aquatica leii]|uniref:Uncharacterized protein n=1 Tax=Aquatica leii TaxID=1421715 RepID=A0AAN7SPV9_9COLE|nr:hypothetical protein RN001_005512 [Aquatica leii]